MSLVDLLWIPAALIIAGIVVWACIFIFEFMDKDDG